MTRLLLASIALAAAFAVAAGSSGAPATAGGGEPPVLQDQPSFCASEPDGGARPAPHGLLMVAERSPALPCAQGG